MLLQMLATLAADPIAGLVDTAYVGRLGGLKCACKWGCNLSSLLLWVPDSQHDLL
jgi:hypothetical protein